MASSTYLSVKSLSSSTTTDNSNSQKPFLWAENERIQNLPFWIYTDNEAPKSIQECKATISALTYIVQDIDLQIEIRELELRGGNSRHNSSFEYEKWKVQALRAKQTHYYLLNAHNYWLIKNTPEQTDKNQKLHKLIRLLVDEPQDFVTQLELLID